MQIIEYRIKIEAEHDFHTNTTLLTAALFESYSNNYFKYCNRLLLHQIKIFSSAVKDNMF